MQEYEYLNAKECDFVLLGNEDAFKGTEKQTEVIINILKEYYENLYILKAVRNYLLGYEIGLIEKQAIKIGMVGIFDYETGTLKIEGEDFSIPYDMEYKTIKKKSMEEAKKLLKFPSL